MSDTETWIPSYAPWRHGGWYVSNVRYPSGAVGCVSNNYSDHKWRIVTENTGPGSEGDRTFANRDAAARAERERAEAQHVAEAADTRQCLVCLLSGPADLFEPMTASGNVACKARECCAIREANERPAHYLSALLRSLRSELAQASTAELAELELDLDGYRADVQRELGTRPDGDDARGTATAYRLARKAATS